MNPRTCLHPPNSRTHTPTATELNSWPGFVREQLERPGGWTCFGCFRYSFPSRRRCGPCAKKKQPSVAPPDTPAADLQSPALNTPTSQTHVATSTSPPTSVAVTRSSVPAPLVSASSTSGFRDPNLFDVPGVSILGPVPIGPAPDTRLYRPAPWWIHGPPQPLTRSRSAETHFPLPTRVSVVKRANRLPRLRRVRSLSPVVHVAPQAPLAPQSLIDAQASAPCKDSSLTGQIVSDPSTDVSTLPSSAKVLPATTTTCVGPSSPDPATGDEVDYSSKPLKLNPLAPSSPPVSDTEDVDMISESGSPVDDLESPIDPKFPVDDLEVPVENSSVPKEEPHDDSVPVEPVVTPDPAPSTPVEGIEKDDEVIPTIPIRQSRRSYNTPAELGGERLQFAVRCRPSVHKSTRGVAAPRRVPTFIRPDSEFDFEEV